MDTIVAFFSGPRLVSLVKAAIILVVGFAVARLITAGAMRVAARRFPSQQLFLRRFIWWGLLALVLASALGQLGVDLSILLGAAGVLTVAVGFASQTSASNLISGLFLLAEKPFVVGDTITVGTTTGEVIAIDLISVKLRTFDNLMVRLPNEMLLKSQITNLSHFPIRRLPVALDVALDEDVTRVEALLLATAGTIAVVLDEPAPAFVITGYGPSAVNVELRVWTARANIIEARNTLMAEIHKAFAEAGVHIPVPRYAVDGPLVPPAPTPVPR